MPLEREMEMMKIDKSPEPIPSRGSHTDDVAAQPSHGAEDCQHSASDHRGPQDVGLVSPKSEVNVEQREDPEVMQRSNVAGDESSRVEHGTEPVSTPPLSPRTKAARVEEMARWIDEQRKCLRLSQGSSMEAPTTSTPATTLCTAYYPLELDMADETDTSANASNA